jgi:hypothetical protein
VSRGTALRWLLTYIMGPPDTKTAKARIPASDAGKPFKANSATRSLRSATYAIDLQNRFVLVKFTGRMTFHDIEDYALHLRANPRFSPSLSEIVDLRDVEQVELSPKQAMNLAARVDPFSRGSKRAFVAQSQAQINASHMHRILRPDADNIRIFLSIEEARRWLGV